MGQWTGDALPDGASFLMHTVAFHTEKTRVEAFEMLSAPVELTQRLGDDGLRYFMTAGDAGVRLGTVFTLRTWPRLPGESLLGGNPLRYQKIILSTRSPGNPHMALDPSGYVAGYPAESALVFFLDLMHRSYTKLYSRGYRYWQRETMDSETGGVDRVAHFVRPKRGGPIMMQLPAGGGFNTSAHVKLTIMTPTGRTIAEGGRWRDPVDGRKYLALDGSLCRIPDDATYRSLWDESAAVSNIPDGIGYDLGLPLTSGAYVARADGRTLLISNGVKRWLLGPEAIDRLGFTATTIRDVPASQLADIPESASIP
jgi:hypothetical protein